jgi:hypothetical protein
MVNNSHLTVEGMNSIREIKLGMNSGRSLRESNEVILAGYNTPASQTLNKFKE